MAKSKENSTNSQNKRFLTTCDMTYAVQLMGGRWKLLIMMNLEKGPLRFTELKRRMEYITERMLTLQLREMESDGLLERTVYPQVPPKVEYQLTEISKDLIPICLNLSIWGTKHRTFVNDTLTL